MIRLCALSVVLLGACKTSGLHDGWFAKDGTRYRVAAPTTGWNKVNFNDNDLAWASVETGDLLAMNATCNDHGDPPLEVLTNHLLFGFTERKTLKAVKEMIDGREALRSEVEAMLDGVPVDLEFVVLKKNGCVHDFTHVSARGALGKHHPAFEALVTSFVQEAAP